MGPGAMTGGRKGTVPGDPGDGAAAEARARGPSERGCQGIWADWPGTGHGLRRTSATGCEHCSPRRGEPAIPVLPLADWAGQANACLPAGTILRPAVAFMGREEPEQRVRAAYGDAAYTRLSAIKHGYDPANTFPFNQNIPPQPAPARQ